MPLFGLFGPPNIKKMLVRQDIDGLIKALNYQKDASIRKAAAEALGDLRNERAVAALATVLHDADGNVRHAAVKALGRIGGADAIELLRAIIDSDVYTYVYVCIEALATMDDERAVGGLIAALVARNKEIPQNIVQEKLAKLINDKRYVKLFEAALLEGTFDQLKWDKAGVFLKNLSTETLVAFLRGRGKGLEDGNELVGNVIFTLRSRPPLEVVDPLIEALHDTRGAVREQAIQTLESLGDGRAVEPFIELITDEDTKVRLAVISALEKLGDNRAVEPLVDLLQDSDVMVRRAVISVLEKLGDNRAVEPLIERLKDEDEGVRLAVVSALEKFGDSRAVEPLIELLQDSDEKVRHVVVSVLEKLGDHRAVEPLIALLKDSNAKVRLAVVSALENLGDNRATEPLVALLKDSDEKVRLAVVSALQELGDERAVAPFIDALQRAQEYSIPVLNLIEALGKLGNARAIEPLEAILDSGLDLQSLESNKNIVIVTAAALESLGWQPNSRQQLHLALARGDWNLLQNYGSDGTALLVSLLQMDQYRREAARTLKRKGWDRNKRQREIILAIAQDDLNVLSDLKAGNELVEVFVKIKRFDGAMREYDFFPKYRLLLQFLKSDPQTIDIDHLKQLETYKALRIDHEITGRTWVQDDEYDYTFSEKPTEFTGSELRELARQELLRRENLDTNL